MWDIVGGRINPGSPLLDNLKREVKEETNLDLTDIPQLVAAQDILLPDKHVVRLTYTAHIQGTPQVSDESLEHQWFSLDEIKQLDNLDKFFKEVLHKKF